MQHFLMHPKDLTINRSDALLNTTNSKFQFVFLYHESYVYTHALPQFVRGFKMLYINKKQCTPEK